MRRVRRVHWVNRRERREQVFLGERTVWAKDQRHGVESKCRWSSESEAENGSDRQATQETSDRRLQTGRDSNHREPGWLLWGDVNSLKNKGKPLTGLKQGCVVNDKVSLYFEKMALNSMQKMGQMEGKSRTPGSGWRQLLTVVQEGDNVSSDRLVLAKTKREDKIDRSQWLNAYSN